MPKVDLPPDNDYKDENVFDLVMQRGDSQNSLRGINLQNKNQGPKRRNNSPKVRNNNAPEVRNNNVPVPRRNEQNRLNERKE